MKKTLGGDRIGSGKKMTFNTKEFNRSTHNLDETFRSSMSAGTLVPFMVKVGLPGDTMDIDLECDIRTLPTIGPLFGSYKVQLDVYQIPWRLYMRDLQMNKLEIGRDMSVVKIPQMEIEANDIWMGIEFDYSKEQPWGGKEINNCQIEPSTILSYLGIKGLGWGEVEGTARTETVKRQFNAMPWLMYWDIFKQYYANKMEDDAYYIHNSMRSQDSLISQAWIVTNNTQINIQVTEMQAITTAVQLGMILEFENYIDYNSFLEEEFVMKVSFTTGGQTSEEEKKGSLDWIIQRNDGQLKIYYTRRTPLATTQTADITIYSDIKYDYVRPNLQKFELKNIDTMREIIMVKNGSSALKLDHWMDTLEPYTSIFDRRVIVGGNGGFEIASLQCKQEGLAVKTYQSDVFNNWLNTEWIEGGNGVSAVTAIQVDENGKFTLDEFNIKKKVYDMLNHIAASGGTYDDWQDVVWGVDRMRQISSPVYEGGLSKEIIFQEVISNSASNEQGEQPLGTLAGRGVMGNKHKGGKLVIKVNEPSYIIGIASITPRVDYSSGNDWHTNLKNMSEVHNPYLDGIAYQDLITDTMAFWDTMIDKETSTPIFKSAGKQPSWINYQTSYNRVYGNFALQNEQMFMVLNRRYEVAYTEIEGVYNYSIGDVTTYIDPSKYNHIFADTSPDAMNFWVQIGIRNEARRVMSGNQIPNL